jgi:hypothetical protein
MKTLNNSKVYITFDEIEEISGSDKEDQHNLPRFYNKNKRGILKAWTELEKNFNENMSFYEAISLLDKFNLRIHSYCSMD